MDVLRGMQEDIKSWLTASKSRSIATLSRLTSVNHQVIRRILNNESEPTADNIIALGEIVSGRQKVIEYLDLKAPRIAKFMRETHLADYQSTSEDVKKYLTSEIHLFPLLLCTRKQGASQDEVLEVSGKNGISALMEMVDEGLIGEESGRFYSKECGIVNRSIFKSFMLNLLKSMDTNDNEDPYLCFGGGFEGFNEATCRELSDQIGELRNRIIEYSKDGSRRGKINWIGGCFSYSFGGDKNNA